MLDYIIQNLNFSFDDTVDEDIIKVAIVGKPNVGKSLFVNSLLKQERSIVSNIPGTTRDSIDTLLLYNNQKYLLIDTAGIRKKSKVKDAIEYYSLLRTLQAVDRADIIILMLDAQESEIIEQDKSIAGIPHEAGKGMVIAVNKWDLIEKDTNTASEYENMIQANLKFAPYAPVVFISALTGQRLNKVLDMVTEVDQSKEAHHWRIESDYSRQYSKTSTSSYKGKQLKVYYATQTGSVRQNLHFCE